MCESPRLILSSYPSPSRPLPLFTSTRNRSPPLPHLSRVMSSNHGGDSRRPLVCYHCKKPGHHIRDCTQRSRAQAPSSTAPSASSSPPDPQQRLKQLLIAIGEQSLNSVEKNLALLATTLLSELPIQRPFILSTLLHCVKALPAKSNIFASLVSLVALQDPTFAPDLLTLLSTAVTHALTTSQHDEFRLLLRFLTSLSHTRIIALPSLFSLTSQVIAFIEAATSSTYRDFYLYSIVSLIPWMGCELTGHADFIALLQSTSRLMTLRPPPTPLTRVFLSDDSEDLLAAYWQTVQTTAQQGGEQAWRTDLILRPHISLTATFAPLNPHPFLLVLPIPPSTPPCPSPPSSPPPLP